VILVIKRFHLVKPGFEENDFNSEILLFSILLVTSPLHEEHKDEDDDIEECYSKVDSPAH
jgi:hypothetical protein